MNRYSRVRPEASVVPDRLPAISIIHADRLLEVSPSVRVGVIRRVYDGSNDHRARPFFALVSRPPIDDVENTHPTYVVASFSADALRHAILPPFQEIATAFGRPPCGAL
jgi:hypothetical protein